MTSWKRDAASGLIVLVPLLVTLFVIGWLYWQIASLTPLSLIQTEFLIELGIGAQYAEPVAEFLRVLMTLLVFVLLVFAIGYLMRTALGTLVESLIDDLINRLPGLRVVYNASKMAIETALTGTGDLQKPVKVQVWDGLRMTAFKTGKTTEDGRDILFLPTAPNITTGFVIEVDPEDYQETEERVEDALTRVLSAGFGETERELPAELVED